MAFSGFPITLDEYKKIVKELDEKYPVVENGARYVYAHEREKPDKYGPLLQLIFRYSDDKWYYEGPINRIMS